MEASMDEVICPHCGKANLLSEKLCHYCQTPLRSSATDNKDNAPAEEEIPAWLKRIREMKKIDEEREKEKDKWRQQTLFGQNTEPQKTRPNTSEKKHDAPRPVAGQPPTATAKNSPPLFSPQIHSKENVASPGTTTYETPPGAEKKDLPEGFQPLSLDEE
jgi:hypothetical protein